MPEQQPTRVVQITSRSNPKIKSIRALKHRKTRQKTGTYLVEGIRHVGEAVEAGAQIEAIYYAPDLLKSEYAFNLIKNQTSSGVPSFPTSTDVFASITAKENPQGILIVVRQLESKMEDLAPHNFPWGVALVSPQDPGNLGTILRTIDAVGASGLLLIEAGIDPYHPSAVRASMGAIFWYSVVKSSLTDFRSWVLEHNYHVYGTSATGDTDYHSVTRYESPCVLLLGSERQGLSHEHTQLCEQVVSLPMVGRASSLNMGVAAGVLLYSMREKITPEPRVK
ncbi:TrmH family RNA methyltransferase [Chloroflexota bacterium]